MGSCGGVPAGVDTVNGPPRPVVEAEEEGSKSLSSEEKKKSWQTVLPVFRIRIRIRNYGTGKDPDLDPNFYINMLN